jgi:alkyl sulfatase BDS1-like metallo-beta-lactamase superfamily hydrolase
MIMPTYPNQPPINPKLEALTSFWSPPGVYQVTSNLWPAVGFGPANIIMIKGTDGLIIIDPGIGYGQGKDELAQMITLPKHLAEHPWLTQGRGLVSWFVKEIYNGYVGWYEGDPAFLNATSLVERSKHIVDGGQTLLKVREAIEKGKEQWASELATYVLKVDPRKRSQVAQGTCSENSWTEDARCRW